MRSLLVIVLIALAVATELSDTDILRAHSTQPRSSLRADYPDSVASMLNNHLVENYPEMNTRACELFTIDELNDLTADLFQHFSSEIQEIYIAQQDSRSLRHEDLDGFKQSWVSEMDGVSDSDEELLTLIRNGKCSELVKFWIHHIPDAVREEIQSSIMMPLLPVSIEIPAETHSENEEQSKVYTTQTDCRAGHSNYNHDACTTAVAAACDNKVYSKCVSCAATHDSDLSSSCPGGSTDYARACYQPNPADDDGIVPTTNDAPLWPDEVTYTAKGFGIYPFWMFGNLKSDITTGTDIHTSWSSTKNAELLEHASCGLSVAGYKDNVACNHLFLGSYSWLYSTDGKFCCKSGQKKTSLFSENNVTTGDDDETRPPPPPPHHGGIKISLTTVQNSWMRGMTYMGTAEHTTPFFSGTIKNYTYDCAGSCGPGSFYFWYYTDMDGNPVEQGEGCQVMPRTANCHGANYIWHNYDPDTFKETTLDWEVFDVPETCLTTTDECFLP